MNFILKKTFGKCNDVYSLKGGSLKGRVPLKRGEFSIQDWLQEVFITSNTVDVQLLKCHFFTEIKIENGVIKRLRWGFHWKSEPIQIPDISSRTVNAMQSYKCPLCPLAFDEINHLKKHLHDYHHWAVLSVYDHAFRDFFCFYIRKMNESLDKLAKTTNYTNKNAFAIISLVDV